MYLRRLSWALLHICWASMWSLYSFLLFGLIQIGCFLDVGNVRRCLRTSLDGYVTSTRNPESCVRQPHLRCPSLTLTHSTGAIKWRSAFQLRKSASSSKSENHDGLLTNELPNKSRYESCLIFSSLGSRFRSM